MIRGILLAAGASTRMGRDKLLLPWRGSTVLATTLAAWSAVAELESILLVRRGDEPWDQWPRVRVIANRDADEGMGSSLRVGVQALPLDTEAAVVGLADMPEVATSTIRTLIEAWRPLGPGGIVAPLHEGKRGHPVVFGAAYFPALRALRGDQGARSILQENGGKLSLVAVDDPGVLVDLDTPADVESRR